MATNNTISQVEVNGVTYDLLDTNTLSAVSALNTRVTALEDSVKIKSNVQYTLTSSKGTFSDLTIIETIIAYVIVGQLNLTTDDIEKGKGFTLFSCNSRKGGLVNSDWFTGHISAVSGNAYTCTIRNMPKSTSAGFCAVIFK